MVDVINWLKKMRQLRAGNEYTTRLRRSLEDLPIVDSWGGEPVEEYGQLTLDEAVELVRFDDNCEIDQEGMRSLEWRGRGDRHFVKAEQGQSLAVSVYFWEYYVVRIAADVFGVRRWEVESDQTRRP